MARIPGVVDMRIAEPLDYPSLKVEVDRAKALQFGVTLQEVASSLLSTLSGAQLLQPNFWLDPVSGVNYFVIAQAPQHLFDSVGALQNIPLSTTATSSANATVDSTATSAATTNQDLVM